MTLQSNQLQISNLPPHALPELLTLQAALHHLQIVTAHAQLICFKRDRIGVH
jgi:hypothetical protein